MDSERFNVERVVGRHSLKGQRTTRFWAAENVPLFSSSGANVLMLLRLVNVVRYSLKGQRTTTFLAAGNVPLFSVPVLTY